MKRLLLFMLFAVLAAFGQESTKYLHISTIPSQADVFVGDLHPDHAKNPAGFAPGFIAVKSKDSTSNEVLISLFKPEYADTTLKVKLSQKDTSFLIVSLRPTYDDTLKAEQERMLKKRSRRNFGHKLVYTSFGPMAISLVSSIVTYCEIQKADNYKRQMKQDLLGSIEDYDKEKSNFRDSHDKAKTARVITGIGAGLGISLFTVGVILSF